MFLECIRDYFSCCFSFFLFLTHFNYSYFPRSPVPFFFCFPFFERPFPFRFPLRYAELHTLLPSQSSQFHCDDVRFPFLFSLLPLFPLSFSNPIFLCVLRLLLFIVKLLLRFGCLVPHTLFTFFLFCPRGGRAL